MTQERFKMPTDEQLVKLAILFNDGVLDVDKLADMQAYCSFILERLYDNGDVRFPSKIEQANNEEEGE